ncbi:MAG: acyltransferase [Bacteroidales bacterium]|nr:acyltransferase [Bacteroidales bacterium]
MVLFTGFLFFRSGFSARIYGKNLKRRVKSLLVPYLFWNLVVVGYYLLLQYRVLWHGEIPDSKLITEYTLHDWKTVFWNEPIARQFWFIRNLMIFSVLSPLIYLVIRYLKIVGLILIALPWLLGKQVCLGINHEAEFYMFLFFFSAGAWLALRKENFVLRMMPLWGWTGILFLLIIIFRVYRYVAGLPPMMLVDKLGVCFSVVFFIALTGKLISSGKLKVNVPLCQSSFFIFAAHFITIQLLRILLLKVFPATPWSYFIIQIVDFAVVLGLCIATYKLLHRFTPRFLSIITGGR